MAVDDIWTLHIYLLPFFMRRPARREPYMNYAEAEEYLNSVPKFTSKNPMEKTKKFYEYIQSVQNGKYREENLGRIVHVAGTNGKGSVCAYMQYIALARGMKTGMFISPHLITTRERFCIDGRPVTEEVFVDAFCWLGEMMESYVRDCGEEYLPSYFERLFFMAVYIFVNEGVELSILETGLGGRLDATNVIKEPDICIITQIGMDHMQYLGNTPEQIAREKAGIIKPDAGVVICDKKEQITKILEDKSAEYGITCQRVSENSYKIKEIKKKSIDFSLNSRYYDYGTLHICQNAPYQVENAALAIRAAELMGFDKASIEKGVCDMQWAGRMEEISSGVYVDGAHNEDGIRAFADCVEQSPDALRLLELMKKGASDESCYHKNRCVLIFSAVNDKEYVNMVKILARLEVVTDFVVTRIPGERGTDLSELAAVFKENTGKELRGFEDIGEALEYALGIRGEDGIVYIVGSLYLVGNVKELVNKGLTGKGIIG